MNSPEYPEMVDLLVIGGGVNGAGIARDASGRGLSVVLCEKGDLAEGTSSRSGRLIHGGLRYLERGEFRLVREALAEREVLLAAAPHIVRPMRFVLPHSPQDRPAWMIRLGLLLYDHLGGRRKLPGARGLDLRSDPEGAPLLDGYVRGFAYSDCWVDDARLVILNALDAAERGARILPRHAFAGARREGGFWQVELRDARTGESREMRSRALVNAAGPWVGDVISRIAGAKAGRGTRLVRGSHLVVPKFWEGQHAYLLQNDDGRVIFVIPHEVDMALLGTTDVAHEGPPEDVRVGEGEIRYLLRAANRYFKEKLRREDVLSMFSGVRPLLDDGKGDPSAVTRDYALDLDLSGDAALVNVFGGKITTFRELSERCMRQLQSIFPGMGEDWTSRAPLPGGEIENADFALFAATLKARYPWMPRNLRERYGRLYGARIGRVIGPAASMEGLGRHYGGQLYEAEVRYLVETEWALAPEDILCRRTKEGLRMNEMERAALAHRLEDSPAEVALEIRQ